MYIIMLIHMIYKNFQMYNYYIIKDLNKNYYFLYII